MGNFEEGYRDRWEWKELEAENIALFMGAREVRSGIDHVIAFIEDASDDSGNLPEGARVEVVAMLQSIANRVPRPRDDDDDD